MTYPILWYSNAPWAATGYGQQTSLFVPRLAKAGYDMAISANWGLYAAPTSWNGTMVYPGGKEPVSMDVVTGNAYLHFGGRPGLVFGLYDSWPLMGDVWGAMPNALWTPVDADRIGLGDKVFLDACKPNKCNVVAMSRHGQKAYERIGVEAHYVPHGIDMQVFKPEGDTLREAFGIPDDAFLVGVNANNKGSPSRKAFAQQFEAFARFARNHKDVMLFIHSQARVPDGEDLDVLLKACEVPDKRVRWSHQHAYSIGILSPEYVAAFYRSCNVVSNATMGEGFGLPTIEAQACGVPVVSTRAAASPELTKHGWLVDGPRHWVNSKQVFWKTPDPKELLKAYEKAYSYTIPAAEIAAGVQEYDADNVLTTYMLPTLEKVEKK